MRTRYWQLFLSGGPVAVSGALRLAWLDRRIARVQLYIEREHDLHQHMLASLRWEANQLLGERASVAAANSVFAQHCARMDPLARYRDGGLVADSATQGDAP